MNNSPARIILKDNIVSCRGAWTLHGITSLSDTYRKLPMPHVKEVDIDGAAVIRMDSAGAYLLQKYILLLKQKGIIVQLTRFKDQFLKLLDFMAASIEKAVEAPEPPPKHYFVYKLGEATYTQFLQTKGFLNFIGESVITFFRTIRHPQRIQWRSLLNIVDVTGFRALPIIALLSFSIGLVLAYQMGLQLKLYGADIYVVNLQGVAILREFGPLITAIIVAGRTSSAYTAQLGTMKVKEEIDALRTMGMSPIGRLVLPKILGLLIALPLLTVWADIFGILGGMFMAKSMLDISFYKFVKSLEQAVSLRTYLIGLSKAPVFALIAATVGCYQGFQVLPNSESVGKQTTKSVVQSIFLIIIADAIFSVLFRWQQS